VEFNGVSYGEEKRGGSGIDVGSIARSEGEADSWHRRRRPKAHGAAAAVATAGRWLGGSRNRGFTRLGLMGRRSWAHWSCWLAVEKKMERKLGKGLGQRRLMGRKNEGRKQWAAEFDFRIDSGF
jgi:hypothetical protein